jgi:PAS domain S-box-containing protein
MSQKILLVEDEAVIALDEAHTIASYGYEVSTVHSGEAAVEAVSSDPDIALILMDIDLGRGMDGTEAAELILRNHHLPIVFLTNHAEKQYVDKVKMITEYGYVLKSSGEFVLIESINMALKLFETHTRLKMEIEERKQKEIELEEESLFHRQIIENAHEGIIVWDENLRYTLWNSFMERITGKNREELLGKHPAEVFPFLMENGGYEKIEAALTKGTTSVREFPYEIEETGRSGWVSELDAPLINRSGENIGAIGLVRDITERKQTEEKYRNVFHSSLDGIILFNENGEIEDVNQAYCRMSGYTKEELLGMHVYDIEARESREAASDHFQRLRNEEDGQFESVHRRKDGTHFHAEVSASYISAYDLVLTFIRDISVRKSKEEELNYLTTLLSTQQEASIDGILIVDADDRIVSYNQQFLDMWDIPPEVIEHRSGQKALEHVLHMLRDPESFAETVHYLYSHRHEKSHDEIFLDDGRCFSRYSSPLFGPDEAYYGRLWMYRDITEQKQTEQALKESEERATKIVHNALIGIFVLVGNTIVFSNPTILQMTGYTREEIETNNFINFVYAEDQELVLRKNALRKSGKDLPAYDFRIVKKDGTPLWVRIDAAVITWKGEEGILCFASNIDSYKKAIREKDFLLKELNHRVKNNLKMVSSLISLKDDELERRVDLSDLSHQVDAIQLVHEKLINSEDITHINVREYLHDLLQTVFSSFASRNVHLEAAIDDISLRTKTAIPVGLIVNELATNALKHGFKEDEEALFKVNMGIDSERNEYYLVVSNTGHPFPEDIEVEESQSLGLQLVSSLLQQIRATLELRKRPNPVFSIRFPSEKE